MTFHLSTQERPRALAKSLKRLLEARGGAISLSASQAAVARMLGHRDWHDLSKSVGMADPSPDDADCDGATVAARRARSVAVVMALGYEAKAAATVVDALHPTSVRPPAAPSGWPWSEGPAVLRSDVGTPLPFAPHSGCRSSSIDLVLGRPGTGKTTLAKAHCRALLRTASTDRPVNVAVVTVGDCYAELAEEVRRDLGPRAVAEIRLENSAPHALNPFDTEPCCRVPSPHVRSWIAELILLLATPDGSREPEISEWQATCCVDALFRLAGDLDPAGAPRRFVPEYVPEVDAALDSIGVTPKPGESWWSVVDELFQAGRIREAELAQRQAVPRMTDIASLARSSAHPNGPEAWSPIIAVPVSFEVLRRVAMAAERLPILSAATTMELAGRTLTVVDLRDFGDASMVGRTRSAVGALLARIALARSQVELRHGRRPGPWVPERHGPAYAALLANRSRVRFHLVLDDFDRVSDIGDHAEMTGRDALEFRKAGMGLLVVAQMASSFGAELERQASGLWLSAMPGLYLREGIGADWTAAADLAPIHAAAVAGGAGIGEFVVRLELTRGPDRFLVRAPRGG